MRRRKSGVGLKVAVVALGVTLAAGIGVCGGFVIERYANDNSTAPMQTQQQDQQEETEEKDGDEPGDDPGNEPGNEPGDNPGDEPGDNPGDEPGGGLVNGGEYQSEGVYSFGFDGEWDFIGDENEWPFAPLEK